MKKHSARMLLPRLRNPMIAAFCALTFAASTHAATFTWTGESGTWSNGSNWAGGNVPDETSANVIFNSENNGNAVDLGASTWTLGALDFTGLWTLTNGTINLDNGGSSAEIKTNTGGKTVIGSDVVLTGNNGFVKRGGGSRTLVLEGANTYSGVTRIAEGYIEIRHDNALGASSGASDYTLIDHTGGNYPQLHLSNNITSAEELRLRLYATGSNGSNNTHLLSLGGSSNRLTGAMLLDRSGGGAGLYNFRIQAQGNLTIDGNISGRLTDPLSSGSSAETRLQLSTTANGSMTVNGVISDGTLSTIGGLRLINDGVGTLKLTAANTYSGGTIILDGTTLVIANTSGSAIGTGSLEARTGTKVTGTGIIAPTSGSLVFQSGARVLPGDGITAGKRLTFDLSGITDTQYVVNFNNGAAITFDISSTNGASYLLFSGLSFADQVIFNNNVIDFNILGGGILADGLYTLAQFSGTGSYTGQFVLGSGLEGYDDIELIYNSDSIQLRVGVIPEPSTWAAIFGGIALVAGIALKRRRA